MQIISYTTLPKKYDAPGQMPTPDDQGKGNLCTRNALSKALTGGLDDGTFIGSQLDVSQDDVTCALVNKAEDVAGRWPTEFNKEKITVMDKKSSEFYVIAMKIVQCTYACLLRDWQKSKFVAVYQKTDGLHCVFVEKVENGVLFCMNSYGNNDQFPQLKPENVFGIYKVNASAEKAPNNQRTSLSNSQLNLARKTDLDEIERLKKKAKADQDEMDRLKEEAKADQDEMDRLREEVKVAKENSEMLSKMDQMNDDLKKASNSILDLSNVGKKEKGGLLSRGGHWIKKKAKNLLGNTKGKYG